MKYQHWVLLATGKTGWSELRGISNAIFLRSFLQEVLQRMNAGGEALVIGTQTQDIEGNKAPNAQISDYEGCHGRVSPMF